MQKSTLLFLLMLISAYAYHIGRHRSRQIVDGRVNDLHSLPSYYGYYTALWCLLPSLAFVFLWMGFETSVIDLMVIKTLPDANREISDDLRGLLINEIHNALSGDASHTKPEIQAAVEYLRHLKILSNWLLSFFAISLAILGAFLGRSYITKEHRARNQVEKVIMAFLVGSSMIAILTTVGIVLSVLFESIRFFDKVPITDFLFGLQWSPQIAMRPDQAGSSGAFGAVPLFTGTLLISAIALIVSVPIGLMSAIYLAEYASLRFRSVAKPLLEILAGIPTVVYGFFAVLTVAPFIREVGADLGVSVSSESALAAGLVMGIMIIPFVSSLSDDFINAVPQALRDGAYALGATQSETIRQVVIPAALPGIVGGILLAASRAIGETMIVVMAAGLAANLTANPLEAVTTVTTQIVTLLVGDQEFDSPKTLAAFALGLVLFVVTLILNIIALHIVRKYREQYE